MQLVKYSMQVYLYGIPVWEQRHAIIGWSLEDCVQRAALKWFATTELSSATVRVDACRHGKKLSRPQVFVVNLPLQSRVMPPQEKSSTA